MNRKKGHTPEEIVAKLRQVEVLTFRKARELAIREPDAPQKAAETIAANTLTDLQDMPDAAFTEECATISAACFALEPSSFSPLEILVRLEADGMRRIDYHNTFDSHARRVALGNYAVEAKARSNPALQVNS